MSEATSSFIANVVDAELLATDDDPYARWLSAVGRSHRLCSQATSTAFPRFVDRRRIQYPRSPLRDTKALTCATVPAHAFGETQFSVVFAARKYGALLARWKTHGGRA